MSDDQIANQFAELVGTVAAPLADTGAASVVPSPVVQTAPQPPVVTTETAEGVKFDDDKPAVHLLPFDSMYSIAAVLRFGAQKYAERNWEKGMAWHRPFGACMRHMWKWWHGEKNDPETGMSHLWHAGCCILFLIAYENRNVGADDRPTTFG